jgi:hypothetical protein
LSSISSTKKNLSASMRQTPLFNVASMRLSYCCHSSMCSQNGFFDAANDFVEARGEAIAAGPRWRAFN